MQKMQKEYKCNVCEFNTNNKTNYKIHLSTEKHKRNVILIETNELMQKNAKFECECGKSYKHNPSLYKHKKTCDYKNKTQIVITTQENNYKEKIEELENKNKALEEKLLNMAQNTIVEQNNKNVFLENTITEQTKVFQTVLIELINQSKQILDLAQKSGNTNNSVINGNNNVSNNQNFNISLFLNEKCKDAIRIDDFVKEIMICINDLLFIKDKGIIKGIANIITNKLKELPLDKRPIWCSDKKRKKIFVKEDNWCEDVDNEKTKKVINDVNALQTKNISSKYKKEYPNYMDNDDEKEKYMIYVKQNTETAKDKEENVINNIIDTIYLDQKSKESLQ